MASEPLMTDRDTIDAKWARENPESAFWWAHEMYFVPSAARISVSPRADDGLWVYRLMDHTESVHYVGQSETLEARLKTHMAQRYGANIEYVMAARCDSVDEMDLVESTLITGWESPLNRALKQFGEGTSKNEADRLADSLDWQLVWGFGTMFWSTKRLLKHIISGIDCISYDRMWASFDGQCTKREVAAALAAETDEQLARSASIGSVMWAPSMRFLFDRHEYEAQVPKIARACRDSVTRWAKKQ